MTDSGRKGVTDQMQEKVKPDSQKSTLEKTSESASGMADRAAGTVQPDSTKSDSQKATDTARSTKDDTSEQSKGMLASAQESVSNAATSVSDSLSGKK